MSTVMQLCLRLDSTPLLTAIEEIKSRRLEAGDIPESILRSFECGCAQLREEIVLLPGVPAVGASEYVLQVELKPDGHLMNVLLALRAIKNGNIGHGGLSVNNGLDGSGHSSGESSHVG